MIGFFLYNFKNGFQKNHLNKLETQVPEIGAHFLTQKIELRMFISHIQIQKNESKQVGYYFKVFMAYLEMRANDLHELEMGLIQFKNRIDVLKNAL